MYNKKVDLNASNFLEIVKDKCYYDSARKTFIFVLENDPLRQKYSYNMIVPKALAESLGFSKDEDVQLIDERGNVNSAVLQLVEYGA
jgi:hypothetical protein